MSVWCMRVAFIECHRYGIAMRVWHIVYIFPFRFSFKLRCCTMFGGHYIRLLYLYADIINRQHQSYAYEMFSLFLSLSCEIRICQRNWICCEKKMSNVRCAIEYQVIFFLLDWFVVCIGQQSEVNLHCSGEFIQFNLLVDFVIANAAKQWQSQNIFFKKSWIQNRTEYIIKNNNNNNKKLRANRAHSVHWIMVCYCAYNSENM